MKAKSKPRLALTALLTYAADEFRRLAQEGEAARKNEKAE